MCLISVLEIWVYLKFLRFDSPIVIVILRTKLKAFIITRVQQSTKGQGLVTVDSIKGKPTVFRLEEESDRDVVCHPYYLTYMENI